MVYNVQLTLPNNTERNHAILHLQIHNFLVWVHAIFTTIILSNNTSWQQTQSYFVTFVHP